MSEVRYPRKAVLLLSRNDILPLKQLLRETSERLDDLRREISKVLDDESRIRLEESVEAGTVVNIGFAYEMKKALRERYEKAEDCFDRLNRSIRDIENFELVFPIQKSSVNDETLELRLNAGQLLRYKENMCSDKDTKTEHGTAYRITDERIAALKPVKLDTLTADQNLKLSKRCRELLERCRKDEILSERGFLLSDSMRIICSAHQLDIEDDDDNQKPSVNLVYLRSGMAMIHNHPYGNGFSRRDLITFYSVDTLRIMGAVGNNGKTYFAEKTSKYNKERFGNYLLDCESQESVKANADKFGVKFYGEG